MCVICDSVLFETLTNQIRRGNSINLDEYWNTNKIHQCIPRILQHLRDPALLVFLLQQSSQQRKSPPWLAKQHQCQTHGHDIQQHPKCPLENAHNDLHKKTCHQAAKNNSQNTENIEQYFGHFFSMQLGVSVKYYGYALWVNFRNKKSVQRGFICSHLLNLLKRAFNQGLRNSQEMSTNVHRILSVDMCFLSFLVDNCF